MKQPISVQITLSPQTHAKVLNLAKDVDCLSATGNPKAASTVKKARRVIQL